MKSAIKTISTMMLGLCLIAGSLPPSAPAAMPADFFKGKTIKIIVGEKPGGGTDLTARTLGLSLSKYLGGKIIVLNKTGAANLEAYNYAWHATPDGLTIGCGDLPSLVSNDLQDAPGIDYQVEKYTFIGSIADEEVIFWVNKNGPIKSFQDLKAGKALKLVSTSVSGMRTINQVMVAYLLDLDAKVIAGLKGSQECDLAIMQGEGTGTTSSTLDYNRGVTNGTHRGLFAVDVRRNKTFSDVPAITELVKLPKEKMDLLKLMVTIRPSKAIYAPPGIPKDRVDFLRKAFLEVSKDEKFKANLEKLMVYSGVPVVSGAEVAVRVATIKKNKQVWKDSFKALFEKYRG